MISMIILSIVNTAEDFISHNGSNPSIRNLPQQSANAEAFAEAYLCFLVSASAKKCQGN